MDDGFKQKPEEDEYINNPESKRMEDIETRSFKLFPGYRFVVGIVALLVLFLIPIPTGQGVTILIEIVAQLLIGNLGRYLSWTTFVLGATGGTLTILSVLNSREIISADGVPFNLLYWKTGLTVGFIRVMGVLFLTVMAFNLGPSYLHPPTTATLWDEFLPKILVLLPLAAVVVKVLIDSGGLDFIGTFGRPVMMPLFGLPGRSVLDTLASTLGSGIVGIYATYDVFNNGGYNKKDVYKLVTCFAPAAIGSLVVGAALLDILHLLPLLIFAWIVTLVVTAFILVRLPPIKNIPEEYVTTPDKETEFKGSFMDYFRLAVTEAMRKSEDSSLSRSIREGVVEGVKLVTVLVIVATALIYPILVIFENTAVFELLSLPLATVLDILAIPNSEVVAVAVMTSVGFSVLPALVASGPGVEPTAAFFVVIYGTSVVVYLGYLIPIAVDLFDGIPMRTKDLLTVMFLRMILLLPIVALLSHLLT